MEYRFNYEYFFNIQEGEALGVLELRIQDALNLLETEEDCIVLVDSNGTERRCANENELREALLNHMNTDNN